MDTLNVMNVGERLAELAFIGPETRAQKKKRDDDESREIRQRISCPDGQFEKIPTKFNETLLNRQKQENRCEKNSSNRSYCCDFETCPDGYIQVSNKGKSNLESNLLEKYCYGREKDNDGNLSYCCNKFDGKLWDPNDKAKDFISQDEIDPENPRSFVTLYPCKQRLGYDESTRQQLINYFFFKPEEFENEYPPENRDKCFASNTQIDFIYLGDYHNDEPYGDNFEVWYDSNIDKGAVQSYLTKCSKGTVNVMITKKEFTGNENGEPVFKNQFTGKKMTYKGELKNGKPLGRAKIIFPDGEVFEGELKNEALRGRVVFPDGKIYEGETKDDGPYKGRLVYPDGKIYEGEFKDGDPYKGRLVYPNGNIYEGEFKNGKENGQGKMIYGDGSVYEGEWSDGKREGQGKLTYPHRKVYEGEFFYDDPVGQGKIYYINGDVFEGESAYGKAIFGKMYYKNGDVYEGEFYDGKREGLGKIIYANGEVYEGEWYDDSWAITLV